MLKQMSENDRDQLKSHLIVPLAVSDILYHDLDVAPDMQYGLHMALSEIDPDSALLAIALCAHDIAEKNLIYVPIASALKKKPTISSKNMAVPGCVIITTARCHRIFMRLFFARLVKTLKP